MERKSNTFVALITFTFACFATSVALTQGYAATRKTEAQAGIRIRRQ